MSFNWLCGKSDCPGISLLEAKTAVFVLKQTSDIEIWLLNGGRKHRFDVLVPHLHPVPERLSAFYHGA